ncbi:hypothetical protein F5878DRAFT_640042 [Lentinula raphanica]|uniref:Uncharacterized protein n=1 Tax=Lentinula raphanica TaxID=153919 RepID=A0AA38UH12_9AGAR|nr:hypothetical protein F5878DRAFT_640042 [Lentinula raphanica]
MRVLNTLFPLVTLAVHVAGRVYLDGEHHYKRSSETTTDTSNPPKHIPSKGEPYRDPNPPYDSENSLPGAAGSSGKPEPVPPSSGLSTNSEARPVRSSQSGSGTRHTPPPPTYLPPDRNAVVTQQPRPVAYSHRPMFQNPYETDLDSDDDECVQSTIGGVLCLVGTGVAIYACTKGGLCTRALSEGAARPSCPQPPKCKHRNVKRDIAKYLNRRRIEGWSDLDELD